MNKSYSKIRHIQESNIVLEKRVLNEAVGDFDLRGFIKDGEKLTKDKLPELINLTNSHFDAFYKKNKKLIDGYNHLKNKMAQAEMASNPKFKLMVYQKDTNPQLVARVTWPFEYNGRKPNVNSVILHIGGRAKFPQWLDTPNVEEISRNIISQKLFNNTSFPK